MAEPAGKRAWGLVLTVLLVASVALAVWYDSIGHDPTRRVIEVVDLAFVTLFLGEWAWRVGRADRPSRYALRHAWELAGMVPLLVPLPPLLRALRLLRVVRLLRAFGGLARLLGVWERIARESNLRTIAAVSGTVTVVGSFVVWLLERGHHPDRPGLDTYWEWLWWGVVTVTTVGYGDITPATASGRLVAAVLMVTGIGTIGLLASSVASALVVRKEREADATGAGRGGPSGAPASAAAVASSTAIGPPAVALLDELERLAALRERGHLSEAEFRAAKARVLGPEG